MRQAAVLIGSALLAYGLLGTEQIGRWEWYGFLVYAGSFFWVNGFLQTFLASWRMPGTDRRVESWQVFFWLQGLSVLLAAGVVVIGGSGAWAPGEVTIWSEWVSVAAWALLSLPALMLPYLLFLSGRSSALVLYTVLFCGVYLLPMGMSLWSDIGLVGIFTWFALGSVVFYTWLLALLFGSGKAVWDPVALRRTGSQARPLVLYALLGGLALIVDAWLVRLFFGDDATFAVYRYGSREIPFTATMATSLSAALIPALGQDLTRGIAETRRRSARLMHLLFPITIVFMLFSGPLFTWAYDDRFSASVPLFELFLLVLIVRVLFPQSILQALRDNEAIFRIGLVELAAHILLSLLLIFYLGLTGLILATLLSYALEKLLLLRRVGKLTGLPPGAYTPIGWWMFYSVALLGIYVLKQVI